GSDLLKAKLESKVKGAKHAEFQRPHQAHVYRHIRVAGERKNHTILEEEARNHHVFNQEGPSGPSRPPDTERRDRIEGLNFDERRKNKDRRKQDEQDELNDQQKDRQEDAAAA